jgi:hypothetical protein
MRAHPMPKHLNRILASLAVAAILCVSGCGGSSTGSAYPTVIVPPPNHLPPITTPNGSVVWLDRLPHAYSTRASASCEWVAYRSVRNKPPGRASLSPPAPGLKATALSPRSVRIDYAFRALPADCRPSYVSLGIEASQSVRATPKVEDVRLGGLSGTQTLTYPSFVPRPDVAIASAEMTNGLHSRPVRVLIRR